MRQEAVDLVRQRVEIGEVHQPDRAAADLVLVSRADAAPGGAYAREHVGGFTDRIELLVQRQDQRGILGDAQALRRNVDPLPLEAVDFLKQRARIDHHPVADHGKLPRPHHARRQQGQLVGDTVDDQRVTCIMSTLEADHDVGLLGQPVDDFALPLVPPLGTNHDHIGHAAAFLRVADARDSFEATKACPAFGASIG